MINSSRIILDDINEANFIYEYIEWWHQVCIEHVSNTDEAKEASNLSYEKTKDEENVTSNEHKMDDHPMHVENDHGNKCTKDIIIYEVMPIH